MMHTWEVKEIAGVPRFCASAPCRPSVSCNAAPLGVVEDVEGLCPELGRHTLVDGEVLEQGHVEVCPAWIAQTVSARIAESQSSGDSKRRRVVPQWTRAGNGCSCKTRVRVTNNVGART